MTEHGTGSDQAIDNLDIMLARAEELLREKRYDDAIAQLREAAEKYPDSPLPHHDLAVVHRERLNELYQHLSIWEDLAEDEEIFEEAVGEEEMALALDNAFLPARNNLGGLFAMRGWWRDAITQWELSLSLSPDQPMVREEIAEVRRRIE